MFPPRSYDSSSAMGLYMAGLNETKGQAAAEAAAAARGRGTHRKAGSSGALAAAVMARREPTTTGGRISSGAIAQHQSSGRLGGGKGGGSAGGGSGVSAAQVIHQKVTSLRAQVRDGFENRGGFAVDVMIGRRVAERAGCLGRGEMASVATVAYR